MMDDAKLKKYVTAVVVASGVAITLPAFATLLVPATLYLTAGILSDEYVKKIGKDGVNYVANIIGNLVASSLQKSPNLWKKSDENHDLLKLLAKAYSKAIEELLKEIEANPEYQEKYQTLAKLVLPDIKNRIDEALEKNEIAELEKLFPTTEYLEARQNTDEQNEKVPFLQKFFGYSPKAKVTVSKEFAGKLPSEDFILSIAEDTESARESLAAEVEISLRRWFAETTPSFDEFPKSLTPFVFERLAEIIPKYVGTLIKDEGFEKSWIAFQRSHLQAILKEVKNSKNGLSDEDRELLRPLAEILDRFSKLEGVPEKLAELSETCLKRFDNLETILENNQNELLKAIDKGEKRLLQEFENLKKQNEELKKLIGEGNLSLEEMKSELANQTQLLEILLSKLGDKEILQPLTDEIKHLSEKINSFEKNLPNSIPPISGFVGRKDYLDDLRESYQNGTRCFVLHGIGGVGKTALALEFASEIAGGYAAKIFVDMQGMSENPLSWQAAMFEVVRQFEREVPADISEAQLANLYVQFAQKQPTLIVLDNAAHKESVEALKRAEACLIVTSRESFVLTDGKSERVSQMSPEDARNLLFENAGGEKRFDGRADELAKLAGYLPMALKPLAALLAEDELETAADLIEKYRDKKELLKERVPDYENRTIEASFELSYEALSVEMKERWRRLSVFPSDFNETAIVAVLSISTNEAKETQKQLRRFSLLEVNPETKRFNLHDLIRTFTDAKLSADERFQTQFLHAQHYVAVLYSTNQIMGIDRENGYVNSLKLFDTEWSNIIVGKKWAVDFGEKSNEIAGLYLDYSSFVNQLLILRLHPREYINWHESLLNSAKILKNKQYEGNSLGSLGLAYFDLGEYRKSIEYQKQYLEISREIRDRLGEGNSLGNLGNAYFILGEYLKAIEYHEQSLMIKREIGNLQGEGNSLNNLGNAYLSLGEYRKAIEYHVQSLTISREIGDRLGEGNSLGNLGSAYQSLGEYRKAIEYYEQSLTISREIGDRLSEGASLGNLGSAYQNLGEYRKAIEYHKQSLAIKREIGDRLGEGKSLGNLGSAYQNLGEMEKACGLCKEALAIFEAIESPNANVVRRWIEKNCN